jgi:UDP-N-acetylmuramoyl-tripeptide--D-alanyl-D-alanine ligase
MKIEDLYQLYLQYPSVQTDSRKLKKDDIFFALRGPSFNGNEFASRALQAGAAYAVIDDDQYYLNEKTIVVIDALQSLQQLAKMHRQQFNIPFLAITGSNGKTTTKELVHAVLSSQFKTSTTIGNLNNHIGVPLTILSIPNNTEIAVIEMGANHQKEIASYCTYALPTHGLITNCGKAHLEGFGGVEGVKKGKGELYDHLRETGGMAFVMKDYDYLVEMSKGIAEVFSYGSSNADITGHALEAGDLLAVEFDKGYGGRINTQLVGNYNLPNVLAAVAVGKYFGVNEDKIKNAIEGFIPSNSRSQLLMKGENKIILDAYNANPSSMKLAVENFAAMNEPRKIMVLGAMAELGEESLQEHQGIIDEISKHKWQEVILVGGDFGKLEHSFKQFSTPEEAGKYLQQIKEQAAYLVKGSRSMQMEKVVEYL